MEKYTFLQTILRLPFTLLARIGPANAPRQTSQLPFVQVDKTNLRGAHLEGYDLTEIDLAGAHLEGAFLTGANLKDAHLEGAFLMDANLKDAHLEGAFLMGANLKDAHLEGAFLTGANLDSACLEGAFLMRASLQAAFLTNIHLEGALLMKADLKGAFLSQACLEGANLNEASLVEAQLPDADLRGAEMHKANLRNASLFKAHLESAILREANLKGAILYESHLGGTVLCDAHLEGCDLRRAHLEGIDISLENLQHIRHWKRNFPAELGAADLRGAFFDQATDLKDIVLGTEEHGYVLLADISWGGVNLAVVNWRQVKSLGDEYRVEQRRRADRFYERQETLLELQSAIRANRQLAIVLQNQGLNEDASRFAFSAQVLRRRLLQLQVFQALPPLRKLLRDLLTGKLPAKAIRWGRNVLSLLFSWFLAILAGYGYKPARSLLWYLVIIFGFTLTYFLLAQAIHPPPLTFLTAMFFSLTSFHGRGFFPGPASHAHFSTVIVLLANIEAVIGLFIEISFIAAFTQRFFGK